MPRYEFSEGSSNKFWEINLSGKAFTATYGKIGSNGQTTIKSYGSDAEAKKAYDKIIAEKVKKGYALANGKGKAKAAPADDDDEDEKPAKKSAKAQKPAGKTAKAASGASSASGKPGARYFEFVEGSSSKFWEIRVDGTTVKTRYGKIGASGQQTIKEFDSKGDAFKELDKLIGEKTRKGYEEKGGDEGEVGAAGAAKGDARNPALEKAIIADPYDANAYAVYADWLQEQGDPRGELMSLQLAGKDKAAKTMIEKHADYFLGGLADDQLVHDEGNNNSSSSLRTPAQEKIWQKEQRQAFLWKNGFIHRVRLSHDSYSDAEYEGETSELLEAVLKHPSARFVVEFAFQSNGDPNENDLQSIIDVLAKKAPPTTRKITFGDNIDQISWHHTGSLAKLWKGVPGLRVLEIETGEFEVGKMEAPALERAIFITGGLSKSCGKGIANAVMPNIQHLEVYYGTDDYGGDCSIKEVRPLLDRTDLKHLTYLGIKNSTFQNEIAKAINGAKILKGIKTLDLSQGTMTDEGAEALAAAKDSLKHLDVLDLTRNYLTKTGIALVKNLAKTVITKDQEKADTYDDETYYYVGVSE